ncbi:MAG: protein kinase, partial [Planctomycetota bacterium]|nr:protein kinase [Planctomycetota bacterium]
MVESPNFGFLASYNKTFVELGAAAERYFAEDPNTCLVKLRQFAELLAREWIYEGGLEPREKTESFSDLINRLHDNRVLGHIQNRDIFHRLRRIGNKATHEYTGTHEEALHQLKMARHLAVLFHQIISDTTFQPTPFIPPASPRKAQKPAVERELGRLKEQISRDKGALAAYKKLVEETDKKWQEAQNQAQKFASDSEEWRRFAQELEDEFQAKLAEKEIELDRSKLNTSKKKRDVTVLATRASRLAGQLTIDESDSLFITKTYSQDLGQTNHDRRKEIVKPGELIDQRFCLESEIASGGMGVVYRAHDQEFNDHCAVKLAFQSGDLIRKRFEREAKISYRLARKIPNVVGAIKWGNWKGIPFLVMALVEGAAPLNLRLGSLPQRLERLLQAAQILERVHEEGVIHRDIKPDNYLRDPNGGLYLSDFGIAKAAWIKDSGETKQHTLTRAEATLGTPAYMSPEQFSDPRTVDVRADVYALGIMLFEVLANVRPYDGSTYEIIKKQHLAEMTKCPSPSDYVKDLAPALVNLCLQSTALDKSQRLATVGGFTQSLKRSLDSLSPTPSATQGKKHKAELWKAYLRKDIPPLFGLKFNKGS